MAPNVVRTQLIKLDDLARRMTVVKVADVNLIAPTHMSEEVVNQAVPGLVISTAKKSRG